MSMSMRLTKQRDGSIWTNPNPAVRKGYSIEEELLYLYGERQYFVRQIAYLYNINKKKGSSVGEKDEYPNLSNLAISFLSELP